MSFIKKSFLLHLSTTETCVMIVMQKKSTFVRVNF